MLLVKLLCVKVYVSVSKFTLMSDSKVRWSVKCSGVSVQVRLACETDRQTDR